MPDKIYPLSVSPGIQRDGTKLSSTSWTDGEWCRFYRGLPKKMGGYIKIGGTADIARGVYIVPTSPNFNLYIGDFRHLHFYSINASGSVIGDPVRRTPSPFNVNPYNLWHFDVMHSTVSNSSTLVAHVSPNLYSVDSNTNGTIFYGDTYSNAPLVSSGVEVSGGIVVLHPNLFAFGNNGEVLIFAPNSTTDVINSARVTGQKIIAGLPTRGGNNSPAGLLWSLDSVIRVTFSGQTGPEDFNFDTVSSQTSILSSRSVIEHDSFYYWIGSDRFLYYDGTVRELPNQTNSEYFFDRLDYSQRQKVWVTKIPRRSEIIWHYPSIFSPNGECDSTIAYNIREKCWYDPTISRSSGHFEQIFTFPIWTDSQKNIGLVKWSTVRDEWPDLDVESWSIWSAREEYSIWLHEKGVDKNVGFLAWANIDEIWSEASPDSWKNWSSELLPIKSGFESRVISLTSYDPNNQRQDLDVLLDIQRIEPDFKQKGKMSLTIKGKEYANSKESISQPYIFYGADYITPTEKTDLREQRRQLTLKFESNVVGGDYEMGQVLMVSRIGDVRA